MKEGQGHDDSDSTASKDDGCFQFSEPKSSHNYGTNQQMDKGGDSSGRECRQHLFVVNIEHDVGCVPEPHEDAQRQKVENFCFEVHLVRLLWLSRAVLEFARSSD